MTKKTPKKKTLASVMDTPGKGRDGTSHPSSRSRTRRRKRKKAVEDSRSRTRRHRRHGREIRLTPRALRSGGLLVARQALQRLERRHAAQEPARGDAIVRHLRERAMQQRMRRDGHRAWQRRGRAACRRRRCRHRCPGVSRVGVGGERRGCVGMVPREGEGGCQRGERFHRGVEETVQVAARCVVLVEVRRRGRVGTVGPCCPRRRRPARVQLVRRLAFAVCWARRTRLRARRSPARSPADGPAGWSRFGRARHRLDRWGNTLREREEQFRVDVLEVRVAVARGTGHVVRLYGRVGSRRDLAAVSPILVRVELHRADALMYPRIRDAQDGLVG